MSGGFGSGFLKGALLSAILAGGLSLALPLSPTDPGQKSQVNLSTPQGSGFNAERADTNPVLPDSDQSVVKEALSKPDIDASEPTVPTADTASADKPVTTGGVDAPKVAAGENDVVAVTSGDAATSPIQPPALGLPMPSIDNPVSEIPVNRLPTITPPTTEVTTPPAVTENGEPSATDTPDATVVASAELPVADIIQEGSALLRNKVVFENPDNKPMIAIILVDAGQEGLDPDVLLTFSFPITFALDPETAGATAGAKKLAHGGFEILALAPSGEARLQAAEDPADIETALAGVFGKLPEAVGLIDGPLAELQKSTTLAEQTIAALKKSGHGLVTYDIGLNTTDKKANRAGVPADTVFRVLDSERENSSVIKRYLDRAVLEAGKTGHVIVLGRTYPETVTALFSWALSAKSATIVLAPVSAVLLAN